METTKAKATYKFKVNNKIYEIDIECPTGAEILITAGYDEPNKYDLFLIKGNQQEIISLEQSVCLSDPGVERFRARPKTVNDGYKGSESSLPFRDTQYLEKRYNGRWELKPHGNHALLYIKRFEIPIGYNVRQADLVILIPNKYDSVQLDMAYFRPSLAREDKKPIAKTSPARFGQDVFQRWSRHRTPNNPWIIGLDCIETHIGLIEFFLENELTR